MSVIATISFERTAAMSKMSEDEEITEAEQPDMMPDGNSKGGSATNALLDNQVQEKPLCFQFF